MEDLETKRKRKAEEDLQRGMEEQEKRVKADNEKKRREEENLQNSIDDLEASRKSAQKDISEKITKLMSFKTSTQEKKVLQKEIADLNQKIADLGDRLATMNKKKRKT